MRNNVSQNGGTVNRKTPIWHWVLAVSVGLVVALVCTISYGVWFLSEAFSIAVDSSEAGEIVMTASPMWAGLSSAVVTAIIVTLLGAGAFFLVARVAGRRAGLLAAGIPALAFVLRMGLTLWSAVFDTEPGVVDAASQASALLAAVLIMLVPAVVGAGLVTVDTRGGSLPSD